MTTAAALEPASGAAEAPEAPRRAGHGRARGPRGCCSRRRCGASPRPSLLGAPLDSIRGIGPKLAEAAGADRPARRSATSSSTSRTATATAPRPSRIAELKLGAGGDDRGRGAQRPGCGRPAAAACSIVEATVADESGSLTGDLVQPGLAGRAAQARDELLLNGRLDRTRLPGRELRVPRGEGGEEEGRRDPLRGDGAAPRACTRRGSSRSTRPARACARRSCASGSGRRWRCAGAAIEPLPRRAPRPAAAGRSAPTPASPPTSPRDASRRRSRPASGSPTRSSSSTRRRSPPGAASARPSGRGMPLPGSAELTASWLASLPFGPTDDQRRAFDEIDADLAGDRPMQRLLMGEVGSGKTVVALYAMLRALEAGTQAALMAPTETLAEQHFQTLERLLAGVPLPGGAAHRLDSRAASRRRTLGLLATGRARAARRHPRPDRARGRVRPPRRRRRRRAAPLRRPPAARARRQGAGRARARTRCT